MRRKRCVSADGTPVLGGFGSPKVSEELTEDVTEEFEGTLLLAWLRVPAVVVVWLALLVRLRLRLRLLRRLCGGSELGRSACGLYLGDDLVELSAVKPNAAALRAVVNLDVSTLGHHQCGAIIGALHGLSMACSATFVHHSG